MRFISNRFVALCFLAAITCCLFLSGRALADSATPAPVVAGWEVGGKTNGSVGFSSPNAAELDGDTTDGLEVLAGGQNGKLYAFKSDGSLLWSVELPTYGCSGLASNQRLWSSPAIGAIYGDGVPYVVIGYGGLGSKSCDGGVMALRGSDGAKAWKFSLADYSKKQHFWSFRYSVVSSPALADVDGDGKLEIAFGGFDRNIYLLNYDGKVRWYYQAADTVWSSPAFADVNGDGKLELIAGSDISANSKLRPPTKNGGFLYAFKTSARKKPLIRFRDKSAYYWQTYFNQVLYSSPVVAELMPNNAGAEIAIGSGCFFPQSSKKKSGKAVKILSLKKGKLLATLSTGGCLTSTPAVADVDGDGLQEVVATVNKADDGLSHVMAWKPATKTLLWDTVPRTDGKNDSGLGNFKSPVIADIDGNGSLEVVVANSSSLAILNAADGTQLNCVDSSCSASSVTFKTGGYINSTPLVADINGDGKLELVAASKAVYAWGDLDTLSLSAPGPFTPYLAPFPMWRVNSAHNGAQ